MEEEYECGGICYQPLFYLAGDISKGRPEGDCFKLIWQDYRFYMMTTFGVTGGILLLQFFLSLPICCGIPLHEKPRGVHPGQGTIDNDDNTAKNDPPAEDGEY